MKLNRLNVILSLAAAFIGFSAVSLAGMPSFAGEIQCSVADGSSHVDFKFDATGNVTDYSLTYKQRTLDTSLLEFGGFNLYQGGTNGFDSQIVLPDSEDVMFSAFEKDKVSTDANGTVHFNGRLNVFSAAPMSTTPATCTYIPSN